MPVLDFFKKKTGNNHVNPDPAVAPTQTGNISESVDPTSSTTTTNPGQPTGWH